MTEHAKHVGVVQKMLMCDSGAHLSACQNYRYALWRFWDHELPPVMFVALNPSIADDKREDPTLIRCINFAQSWGYGGVLLGNLFAGISTDPKNIRLMDDPVGRDNDSWLSAMADAAEFKIAAWGNYGAYCDRASKIFRMLAPMFCLKENRSGHPAHPLYQKACLRPKSYKGLSKAI